MPEQFPDEYCGGCAQTQKLYAHIATSVKEDENQKLQRGQKK